MKAVITAAVVFCLAGSSHANFFESERDQDFDEASLLRRRLRPRYCPAGLKRYGQPCESWDECCSENCKRGKCYTEPMPTHYYCDRDGQLRKMQLTAGRPFRVNGESVSAPLVCSAEADKRIKLWKESAQGEHASVASFADLSLKLFSLGAPLDLLQKAANSQLQEVHHAKLMVDLIKKANNDDSVLEFGAVDLHKSSTSPFDTTYEKVMLESLDDGCLNEGIAANLAAEVAKVSNETHVKNAYEIIARDEQKHGELAWDIVEWVLSVKPELADTAKAAYAKSVSAIKKAGMSSFPGAQMISDEAGARALSKTLEFNEARLGEILKL